MDAANIKEVYPIQSSDLSRPLHPPEEKQNHHKPILPKQIRALKEAKHSHTHQRTLIICLDGTGDQFDNDNSNVVHFVSCLKKHTPSQQMTYYQSGIGTYDKGGLRNGIGAAMDMAVGSGLGIHVKDAYRFLMQNYREGDKICLLGFSRGAYTVRCLSGMLHKVGLLPASNSSQVNFAYDFYKDQTEEGYKMSAEFKRTFCTDVSVHFLGLWDCVASVGFIPRKLPFSKSATDSVRYVRHAMALNEHRSKFKVCQWQHADPNLKRTETFDDTPKAQFRRGLEKTGLFSIPGSHHAKVEKAKASVDEDTPDERTLVGSHTPPTGMQVNGNEVNGHENGVKLSKRDSTQEKLEQAFNALDSRRDMKNEIATDVVECWFMGCHADVGGGAVANEKRHMLSRIPLRWMLRQCFECDTGILFDTAMLADMGLDLHTLYPKYQTPTIPAVGPAPDLQTQYENGTLPPIRRRSVLFRIGKDDEDVTAGLDQLRDHQEDVLPEACENHFDALARVNDQLVDAKGWWVLEFWPIKLRVLNKEKDGWVKKVRFNRGTYRCIRDHRPNLHWTAQRMVDEKKYTMKVRKLGTTTWNLVA